MPATLRGSLPHRGTATDRSDP